MDRLQERSDLTWVSSPLNIVLYQIEGSTIGDNLIFWRAEKVRFDGGLQMSKKPIAAGKSSFGLIDSEKLFDELGLKKWDILLDLACGNGLYSLAAANHIGNAGRIYSVDLWEEGISSLQSESGRRNLNQIHPVVADVSKHVPLDDGSVDVCLMATVLHDLIEDGTDAGALAEVKRVLKPQGWLALIEFKKIDGPPGPSIHIRLSPEDSQKHLQPYGFHLNRTIDIGQYNYLQIYENQGF